jgi:hypothetical protein
MADDIKFLLSRNATEQLHKNFKSLKSSVKVDPPKDDPKDKDNNVVSASFTAVTDSVRLSAEAVRSLANSGPDDNGTTDDSIPKENVEAARSDVRDLQKARQLAERAGFKVQAYHNQALAAQAPRIDPQRVFQLLSYD